MKCACCGCVFWGHQYIVNNVSLGHGMHSLCPKCHKDLYTSPCLVCGNDVYCRVPHETALCDIHNTPEVKKEARRLLYHLNRSKRLGNEATLALNQWLRCIEYFNHRCAYCGVNEFQVLEHIVSVTNGGGTTIKNCLPSCNSCNTKKGSKSIARTISMSTFTMIQSYYLNYENDV